MAWVVRRPTEYLEDTTCPNSRHCQASTIAVRILPSYTAPVYLRSSTHKVSYHGNLVHARAMCTRPFLFPSKGPGYEANTYVLLHTFCYKTRVASVTIILPSLLQDLVQLFLWVIRSYEEVEPIILSGNANLVTCLIPVLI